MRFPLCDPHPPQATLVNLGHCLRKQRRFDEAIALCAVVLLLCCAVPCCVSLCGAVLCCKLQQPGRERRCCFSLTPLSPLFSRPRFRPRSYERALVLEPRSAGTLTALSFARCVALCGLERETKAPVARD